MKRKHLLLAALVPALLLGACSEAPQGRPNVVLIIVDTLRGDAIFDAAGRYDTPNIDQLAADGVGFPNTFAHAPMTLPAHTALFSSRFPFDAGVVNNGQTVPASLPLMAEWMGEFGYDARAVLSLGTLVPQPADSAGLGRGFESYDTKFWNLASAENVHERLLTSLNEHEAERPLFLFAHYCDPHEPYDSHEDDGRVVRILAGGREIGSISSSNMVVWDEGVSLTPGKHVLDLRSEFPFRVRWFNARAQGEDVPATWIEGKPHQVLTQARVELEVSEEHAGQIDCKLWVNDRVSTEEIQQRYAREVSHVDRYVGELIKELKQRGLYENSVIVFTSDHGEALGEHGRVGHVEGLTDDMIHVPLIVKLPTGHPRAKKLKSRPDMLVRHIDLMPTLLELTGLPPLPGQKGRSMLGTESVVHFAQTHRPEASKDRVCLRDERYKMILDIEDDRFRMFDVQADPGENRDIFETTRAERADWPGQLRALAKTSMGMRRSDGETDAALLKELQALGYGGDQNP